MIKIPTESQRQLEQLMAVREKLEEFPNEYSLNNYLKNVDKKNIKERNIHTIFSNLKNNKLFKFGNERTQREIKEILSLTTSLKILKKEESFKLFFYLYQDSSEEKKLQNLVKKFCEDESTVNRETLMEFMLENAKSLYSEWKFPLNLKVKYKIFEELADQLQNPETLKNLSPMILELARYFDLESLDNSMKEKVKTKMKEKLPREIRSFFKKYKRVGFSKAVRENDKIYIFLEDREIIRLNMKDENLSSIELLDKNRYINTMNGNSIQTQKIKNSRELAKVLRSYGHDIKWIEIDTIPKIIGILAGTAGIIAGMYFGICTILSYFQ